RGVFNHAVLGAAKEIILCEALIDALTFWCAGYRNVTSCYGVEGFTDDMLEAFKTKSVKRVLIAFDRDDAGDKAAEKLAQRLAECGIDCYRVLFPKGMDANEYAQKMQPADRALGLLLRKAQWMGQGKPPARDQVEETVQLVPVVSAIPLAAETAEPPAAVDLPELPEPMQASPL